MLKNATMVSVLVVDDDEAIARLIGATLRSAGYAADWASTADDALQLVKRTPYDLLVVDYQLAGLTGLYGRLTEEAQALAHGGEFRIRRVDHSDLLG